MSEKITQAYVKENYLVESNIEGFNYTMDYTERYPDRISQGTSPTGLLIVSLLGCHLMTAVSYLNMKNIAFDILKGEVEADFIDEKSSWKLDAKVTLITDAKLSEDAINGLTRFIHRHCKVSSMLSHGNDISLEYSFIK
ncbi:OsmC family protein [Aerococcaceae bacterium WGS1372]